MTLAHIFAAGRVRRWHSNPDMSQSDDFNDGHQGRVARLLLALHPKPSPTLLAVALTHDDGELRAGDASFNLKVVEPKLRAAIKKVEKTGYVEIWGTPPKTLGASDRKWLEFCDRLDAYMWMVYERPGLQHRPDWSKQLNCLLEFVRDNDVPVDLLEELR